MVYGRNKTWMLLFQFKSKSTIALEQNSQEYILFKNLRQVTAKSKAGLGTLRFGWPSEQCDSCSSFPPWPLSTVNQKPAMKITGKQNIRSFQALTWKHGFCIIRDARLKLAAGFWSGWETGLKTPGWLFIVALQWNGKGLSSNFFLTFNFFPPAWFNFLTCEPRHLQNLLLWFFKITFNFNDFHHCGSILQFILFRQL